MHYLSRGFLFFMQKRFIASGGLCGETPFDPAARSGLNGFQAQVRAFALGYLYLFPEVKTYTVFSLNAMDQSSYQK